MPKAKPQKETKRKEQEKHPVEPIEIIRHEEKIFSYTYRKTGKPILSEIWLKDDRYLWGIQAKTELTQLHNLFIIAMITLGFKNQSFTVAQNTVISKITNTPSFICVASLKELRNCLPKKISINSFQEIQRISEELTKNCPVEITLLDKNTKDVKFKGTTQLITECGYLSDDIETVKAMLPNSTEIVRFIEDNKVDLEKINEVAKPKETGNLFITLSPVYTALFYASKLRINYSTVILEKFKSVPDGLLLSTIKYIISQKAPYTVKVDTVVEKIAQTEINEKTLLKTIRSFKSKLDYGKFDNILAEFSITYDREKGIFIYPKNIKGVGFSEPFKSLRKTLVKALVGGETNGQD